MENKIDDGSLSFLNIKIDGELKNKYIKNII